jgi:hypothetical protein
MMIRQGADGLIVWEKDDGEREKRENIKEYYTSTRARVGMCTN